MGGLFLRISPRAGAAIALATAALVVAAAARAAAQDPSHSVLSGVYTEAQAQRGGEFYERECSSCHGQDLSGGEESPALAGVMFLGDWNGQSVAALVDQTRKSMPKDVPGKFTRQQYVDAIAFILHGNGYPTGKAELPVESESLAQIKIELPAH